MFLLFYITCSFYSASTRENREFINTLHIVKESKVFSTTTKGKEENIESTQGHSAADKNKVEQNVEKKGKYLI